MMRIRGDAADGIKQRAVARDLARKPAQPAQRLGGDEMRGQNDVTVVARLEPEQTATVECVGDGRKPAAPDTYGQRCPPSTAARRCAS